MRDLRAALSWILRSLTSSRTESTSSARSSASSSALARRLATMSSVLLTEGLKLKIAVHAKILGHLLDDTAIASHLLENLWHQRRRRTLGLADRELADGESRNPC
jgi:hypothetical protein